MLVKLFSRVPSCRVAISEPYGRAKFSVHPRRFGYEDDADAMRLWADDMNQTSTTKQGTIEEAFRMLVCESEAAEPNQFIFAKELAECPLGSDMGFGLNAVLPPGFTPCFLMRDPRRQIQSLYRASTAHGVAGLTVFCSHEEHTGWPNLEFLFEDERAKRAAAGLPPPLLIDSDDLLLRPEAALNAMCLHAGLQPHITQEHLRWEPDPQLDFGSANNDKWNGILNSSAGVLLPSDTARPNEDLPPSVLLLLERATAVYNRLLPHRWQPKA